MERKFRGKNRTLRLMVAASEFIIGRRVFAAMVTLSVLSLADPLFACPVCDTDTGKEVRAGIFDKDFSKNIVLTLLPFPIFFAIAALIYRAPGRPQPTLQNKLTENTLRKS